MLAAARLAPPFQRLGHADVRRAVQRADEVEVRHEGRLATARQRVREGRGGIPRHEAVGRGQRGADEGLVARRDVEDGAAARHEEPLVQIGDEEIGIQGRQVEIDVAEAVGAVDEAQDALAVAGAG